jgi:FKBP-type peptidyl-prolyl cis-trans isomerase FklB
LFTAVALILSVAWFCLAGDEGPAGGEKPPALDLKNVKVKTSYAFGVQIGNMMKRQGVDIDPRVFFQAFEEAYAGKKALLSEDEVNKAVQAESQRAARSAGERNLKDGAAFLAKNAEKEGVKTTASGLQYEVLKEGDGPSPKATDRVQVHYRGTLIDGTEFDSSYSRGQPAAFPLNRVIPGWTEGLQLMKVGAKFRFVIPSKLAYGPRGAGRLIGPHCTLVFEVELLAIQ